MDGQRQGDRKGVAVCRGMHRRAWSSIGLIVLLSGCVTIDPPRDHVAIEQLLTDHGAGGLPWDQNGVAASRDALQPILAKPLDRETALRVAMLNSPRLQQVYGELGVDFQ